MSQRPEIILRGVTEADLPILFEFQREPEANEMAAFPARSEIEFFRHWRERILVNPDVIMQAIEWDGQLVGHVAAFNRDGRRLIGYWIGKRYWGRGLATAAVTEFLASRETTRPLSAFVAVRNVASFRVLQKCGFRQAGKAIRASDGIDELRMELR